MIFFLTHEKYKKVPFTVREVRLGFVSSNSQPAVRFDATGAIGFEGALVLDIIYTMNIRSDAMKV